MFPLLILGPRPHSQFGIMGLHEKSLGFWDYTLFEIGITEIMSEFGIIRTKYWTIPYGITPHLKLGLWDYTPFEIGIMGLQDPPMGALILLHTRKWYSIRVIGRARLDRPNRSRAHFLSTIGKYFLFGRTGIGAPQIDPGDFNRAQPLMEMCKWGLILKNKYLVTLKLKPENVKCKEKWL